ncbi:unnamed protein product [Mytilus coruscus]|uniref:Uncharacterized protein n=1 Tax=Mytilus coruscus TaxID=42192 RepID=A0A6J8ABY7_MYTCO|nr:unnamed protein product [Mytilus coruscus]
MCKYVVGTENHIKTIRLMNTFTDNLSSNNIKVTITSGSFGEGLQMPGSDLDIMLVDTTVDVHDEITSIVFDPTRTNFSLMTEDIKAGFAMLRFISSPNPVMRKICEKFKGRAVHYSLAYKTKKFTCMHAYFMSLVCNTHCQSEYVSSTISNKKQYKQYNTCQSYLHININHDTVSGWMMLASFFYKENQYQRCLNIIVYALSKCTHHNLFLGSTVSAMQRLEKYGVVRSFKFVLEDHVIFKSSAFIPIELLIEGNFFAMPPTIYAHFLSFLCHYHLNNTHECRNSLRDLKLTIAEYHFTGKIRSSKSASYYCLGTALQLLGDCVSAKEAFTNTVKLMPHPFFLKTMKRLPPIAPS